MIQKDTEKAQKNATNFVCKSCNFECSKKSDWDRHIMRPKDNNEDDSDDSNSGFFSFFSSKTDSTKNKALVVSSLKDKEEIEAQVVQQMYDYQVYRLALNNRQSFLNGLCFNTFGDPYTLYYNSDNNNTGDQYE